MTFFLQVVANGLFIGAGYGLIAISLALVFKATGILNFAQGEMLMLTSYIAYALANTFSLSFVPLIIVLIPIAMLLGALVDWLLLRPMAGQPMFSIVMVTMGLAVVLRGVVIMIWGPAAVVFDAGLPTTFINLGFMSVQASQIVLLAAFVIASALVWFLLRFTRLGVAMRAVASNERSALLMGIKVKRVHTIAWAIGSAISAIAGLLISSLVSLNPEMWSNGLRAFPAVILGGIDAPVGGAAGGAIIGIVENLAQGFVGQGLREIAGFVVIIFVLTLQPNGIFGSRRVERV